MLWRRRRTEADFRDEIQAHLELETARLVEEGMTPAEASAAARRAFGNVTSPQEQFYESGRSISLDHLLKDLRFALRLFRKRPGFSAVVVLTLAVGIGVHTAVFSLLSAFVLAPLPFDRPRQLVHIWSTDNKRGLQELRLSDADFEDIRRHAAGYESLAAYDYYDANVRIGEEIVSVRTARVTPDLFQLLGVQPWRGRNFATGESAENVAIVSTDFWERHWGGRLDLSGAQIDINQVPHHIVGVMPSSFTFPMPSIRLWVPLKIVPNPSSRGAGGLMVVGRLKGDTSLEDANAEMRVVATRLERAYPKTNTGRGLRAVPLREALTFFYQELRALLLALNLGAAFVLLIVCANLGNLLLVRAVTRSPEVAMRLALGATRTRLLIQMLVEGAVPAAAGGLVGVAGAKALTSLGGNFLPEDLYRASDPAINWPVLAFAAAISLMSVLLFALAPALEAIRCRTPQMLGQKMHGSTDSPRARRLRTSLAVGQVALAAILLSGAFFAIQAAVGLQQVESGFSTHGILTFQITPSENRHSGPDQINSFFERLIEEIESLPGVRKAAAVHPLPLNFELFQQEFQIDSGDDEKQAAALFRVTPGYLETLGVPLSEGRDFQTSDRADAPSVLLINQTLARKYWPGQSPVGKQLRLLNEGRTVKATIIGVIQDTKAFMLAEQTRPQLLLSQLQFPNRRLFVIVRTSSGDGTAVVPAIRRKLASLDRTLPMAEVRTMDQVVSQTTTPANGASLILTGLGVSGLLLAALGVYAVTAYSVRQRTREIGIRIALGANRHQIRTLIVRQGLKSTGVGLLLGAAGVFGLAQVLAALLGSLPAGTLVVLSAGPLLMAAVALSACIVPARAAASANPVLALREE